MKQFTEKALLEKEAFIALEDGTIFRGFSSFGKNVEFGEVVFNTAMTGYQEICTDPSYANQIVVFTTSHIGNVGVNKADFESKDIWVKGVVASSLSKYPSNWRAEKSFIEFLEEKKIPWIEKVDTRRLAKHIRDFGLQSGSLVIGNTISAHEAIAATRLSTRIGPFSLFEKTITNQVIQKKSCQENASIDLICVYDFGAKSSIIERLSKWTKKIVVIPGNRQAEEVLSFNPDAIILPNGPGDPSASISVIRNIKRLIRSKTPMLGICFGHQILALALGAKTKKMVFGHHGVNHPVYDLEKEVVYMTSQNHNYMIDKKDFPAKLQMTHLSLFDGSIQGFRSEELPIMGFQGHPEGSPGPRDIEGIFKTFFKLVHEVRNKQARLCH